MKLVKSPRLLYIVFSCDIVLCIVEKIQLSDVPRPSHDLESRKRLLLDQQEGLSLQAAKIEQCRIKAIRNIGSGLHSGDGHACCYSEQITCSARWECSDFSLLMLVVILKKIRRPMKGVARRK